MPRRAVADRPNRAATACDPSLRRMPGRYGQTGGRHLPMAETGTPKGRVAGAAQIHLLAPMEGAPDPGRLAVMHDVRCRLTGFLSRHPAMQTVLHWLGLNGPGGMNP